MILFLATGVGIKYLLSQAEDIAPEDTEIGNLVLTQLGANLYSLTGDVGTGDCERIVPQLPTSAPFTLILESPGGSLGDGMCLAANLKLRNVITVVRNTPYMNEEGIVTYTPGVNTEIGKEMTEKSGTPVVMCASSCSLIFLAGDERYLIGNVYLGIHAPRSQGDIADGTRAEASAYDMSARLLSFLEYQMGLESSDLRRLFISVPAASMYYVHPKDFNRAPFLSTLATHYYGFWEFNYVDVKSSIYAAVMQQAIEMRNAQEQERGE